MNSSTVQLLKLLSSATPEEEGKILETTGPLGTIAKVFEVARNALEYRAEHLVRRAAIERILRRYLYFQTDTTLIARQLFQELQWALYLTEVEERRVSVEQVATILETYIGLFGQAVVPRDWLLGLVSSQIEELLNPNTAYRQFNLFVYQILRPRVTDTELDHADLLLFVAIQRIFAQADDAQISKSLYLLVCRQMPNTATTREKILEAFRQFQAAIHHPQLARVSAFVRRNVGPIILLRDIYFAVPSEYLQILEDKEVFFSRADQVLRQQLTTLKDRMSRASTRALISVFLSKILIVLLVELPLEKLLSNHFDIPRLIITIVLPVIIMAVLTALIKLPSNSVQQKLILVAWQIVNSDTGVGEILHNRPPKTKRHQVFGIFYAGFFVFIFVFILYLLRVFGFNLINSGVFLFFLSLVCFFAYRIRQAGLLYNYSEKPMNSGVVDTLMLPVVTVGGWFSAGISRLNIVIFIFDFILEAPFKLVLRFVDSWFSFLTAKRDETVS